MLTCGNMFLVSSLSSVTAGFFAGMSGNIWIASGLSAKLAKSSSIAKISCFVFSFGGGAGRAFVSTFFGVGGAVATAGSAAAGFGVVVVSNLFINEGSATGCAGVGAASTFFLKDNGATGSIFVQVAIGAAGSTFASASGAGVPYPNIFATLAALDADLFG